MPRSPQDRVKVNLFLQADVLAALKKMATIRGTTYSDLVREACRRFVVAEAGKLIEDQKQLDAIKPAPVAPLPFVHWTKDPMVPYAGCQCQTCTNAITNAITETYTSNNTDDTDPRERG